MASRGKPRESLSSPPTLRRGEVSRYRASGKHSVSPSSDRQWRDHSASGAGGGYDSSGGPYPAAHAVSPNSNSGKQIQDSLRLKRPPKRRYGILERNQTAIGGIGSSGERLSSRQKSSRSATSGPAVVSGAGVSAGRPVSSRSPSHSGPNSNNSSSGQSRRIGARSVGRIRGRNMTNRRDNVYGTVIGGRGIFESSKRSPSGGGGGARRPGSAGGSPSSPGLMSLVDALKSTFDDGFDTDAEDSEEADEEAISMMSLASSFNRVPSPAPSDMSTSSNTMLLPQSLSSRSNSKQGGKTPSRLRRGMLRKSKAAMDEAPAQSDNSTSASASRRGAASLFGKRTSLTETFHGSLSQLGGGGGGGAAEHRSNSSRSVGSAPSSSTSPVDKKRRQGLFYRGKRRQNGA